MTEEHKQRMQEEREDAALKLLMNEYAEIEGEALWREFQAAQAAEDDRNTPRREDRESGRGSRESNRRIDCLKRTGNCCKRAAVLFLVLVCLLSPLVVSVEAFRIPVIDYLIALENKFSEFNFGKNETFSGECEDLLDLILYVPRPQGYFFSKQEVSTDGKIWLDFEHGGKNTMRISIYPSTGQINIDTEDIDQISMNLNDYEAIYLEKEGHRLMWIDTERELIFDLYAADLEEDAFWTYVYTLTETLSQ